MISNSINTLPNTFTPFSSVEEKPVGQQNTEVLKSTIKPIEETPKTEKNQRRGRDIEKGNVEKSGVQKSEADEKKNIKNNGLEKAKGDDGEYLSEEELDQIKALASRDQEVRDHERAHASVGGQLAGAASYGYEQGPDGKRYAVSGEVPISIKSNPTDPSATLANARQVARAALAPAEPSSQDRRIASQASQVALEATQDITELAQDKKAAELSKSEDKREVEQLAKEKKEAVEQKQSLQDQQQRSQAEINRKGLELTRTLVQLELGDNITTPGKLINSVS